MTDSEHLQDQAPLYLMASQRNNTMHSCTTHYPSPLHHRNFPSMQFHLSKQCSRQQTHGISAPWVRSPRPHLMGHHHLIRVIGNEFFDELFQFQTHFDRICDNTCARITSFFVHSMSNPTPHSMHLISRRLRAIHELSFDFFTSPPTPPQFIRKSCCLDTQLYTAKNR